MEETNNNSTPTPTKGSRTGVVVAFVVVILVITGALWYSFSGTNDNTNNTNKVMNENTNVTVNTNTTTNTNSAVDTSDWETYTNEMYSYSFKYPNNWDVVELSDPKAGIALKSSEYQPINSGSVEYSGEIYVSSLSNPENLSAQELFETYSDSSRFWFEKYSNDDEIMNGKAVTYFRSFTEDGQEYSQGLILVPSEDKIISVNYYFVEDDIRREEFENIASTVVFID